MDVGNDPFPRDEVTGLAAFENLEPVSSLNVVPQEPEAQSAPPEHAASAQESAESSAPPPNQADDDERRDPTLPLDLTVDQLPADPNQPVDLPYAANPHAARGDADHLFDGSHGAGGWDDPDEATRVASPRVHGPSTNLEMEWDDDDEPPTQMRPGAMFDVPPVSANTGWDDPDSSTSIYDESHELHDEHDLEEEEELDVPELPSALQTMSGGRPSPFPVLPQGSIPSLRDFGLSRVAQASAAMIESQRTVRDTQPVGFVASLRAGDRRAWLLSGGAALGVIALALIIRGLAGGSSTASVMFATTPTDAKAFVDGKEVMGTASPYSLPDVAAGKHELVVKKPGFKDYSGSFVVARGETKSLPSVELVPTVRETGFSVRSTPEGASVWLDGNATDKLTPARMTGVAPGIHRLQLKHAGYSDFELQLFVPDATVLQLPAAELVASAEPPAAAAVKEPEQPVARTRGRSRSSDDDAVSDARSARSSRRSRNREDDVGDSRATSRASRSSSHSSWRDASPRSSSSYAASSSRGSSRAPVLTSAAPSAAAPIEPTSSGKLGMLRINSRPWSQVFVDGRMVGNTPQQGVPLNPGRHKVQLVNPQMGLNKTVSVNIKAGQVATQVVNLAD